MALTPELDIGEINNRLAAFGKRSPNDPEFSSTREYCDAGVELATLKFGTVLRDSFIIPAVSLPKPDLSSLHIEHPIFQALSDAEPDLLIPDYILPIFPEYSKFTMNPAKKAQFRALYSGLLPRNELLESLDPTPPFREIAAVGFVISIARDSVITKTQDFAKRAQSVSILTPENLEEYINRAVVGPVSLIWRDLAYLEKAEAVTQRIAQEAGWGEPQVQLIHQLMLTQRERMGRSGTLAEKLTPIITSINEENWQRAFEVAEPIFPPDITPAQKQAQQLEAESEQAERVLLRNTLGRSRELLRVVTEATAWNVFKAWYFKESGNTPETQIALADFRRNFIEGKSIWNASYPDKELLKKYNEERPLIGESRVRFLRARVPGPVNVTRLSSSANNEHLFETKDPGEPEITVFGSFGDLLYKLIQASLNQKDERLDIEDESPVLTRKELTEAIKKAFDSEETTPKRKYPLNKYLLTLITKAKPDLASDDPVLGFITTL